jgi:predicted O-methyltransferase YrrM
MLLKTMNLASAGKKGIGLLPGPYRFYAFNILRGIARLVHPEYRRRAKLFSAVGGGEYKVRQGPFVGMKYLSCAAGSVPLPKILGTYEMELEGAVAAICNLKPDLIVDVGSAEGYYAVGMAMRNPQARVICFDIDRFAIYLLKRLSRMNRVVERVESYTSCTPQTLQDVLAEASRPVVIMDVEGAEDELLRPDLTPSLSAAMLLVEIHDADRPGVSGRIEQRFADTHELQRVVSRDRTLDDLPANVTLQPNEALEVMDEGRHDAQQWFILTPRTTV